MLRDLVDRCRTFAAFVQSVVAESFSGGSVQDKHLARSNAHHSTRRDARRLLPANSEDHSDFRGEAPNSLLIAYREAAEADQGDERRRRSFVI